MERKHFTFSCSGIPQGIVGRCEKADGAAAFGEGGLWVSPAVDSGEDGTVWDTALIDCIRPEKGSFRFIAAASDSDYIEHDGGKIPLTKALADYIRGGASPVEELDAAVFVDADAVPLHKLRGRWLLFAVQFFPEQGSAFMMKSVSVSCSAASYMELLPEVFAKTDNGALNDLLAMYRAVTDETDRSILGLERRLDPDRATGKDLERLLAWQGIGVTAIWEEQRLRELIKNSARLVRLKGTQEALSELFEILLGEKPIITAEKGAMSFSAEVSREAVKSGRHYAELLRLLKDFSPAGITPRLVIRRAGAEDMTLSDDRFGSGFII